MSDVNLQKLGGVGPPALMVHGFAADRLAWAATAPAMQKLLSVYVVDLPGHGQSLNCDFEASVGGLADCLMPTLTACARQHGGQPLHLFGHSLGGSICMCLAARARHQVASLTLVAPVGLGGRLDREFLHQYPHLHSVPETLQVLSKLVADRRLLAPDLAELVLLNLQKDGARENLMRLAIGLDKPQQDLSDAVEQLAGESLPRCVVWGREDKINEYNEQALQAFGGEHHILDNSGHLVHMERRAEVNTALRGFIAGCIGSTV